MKTIGEHDENSKECIAKMKGMLKNCKNATKELVMMHKRRAGT